MPALAVHASRGGLSARFTLHAPARAPPSFAALCHALVHQLGVPVTAEVLADTAASPFHIRLRADDGSYARVYDQRSLDALLAAQANPRRVHVRVARRRAPRAPAHGHCEPPACALPHAALRAMFDDLRADASREAADALCALERSVAEHHADARALRRRRHRLAALCSAFLADAALPGHVCIPRSVGAPFIEELRAELCEAGVSGSTVDAALRAVKVVCNCRHTATALRSLYVEAVCKAAAKGLKAPSMATAVMPASVGMPFNRFPVNHYATMFRRMRCAGGPDVRDAYHCFAKARAAADLSEFVLTRRLCRSIQRTVFHFLRCHAAAPDDAFDQNAMRALGSSVVRKLLRAYYDPNLVDVTMDLILVMAMDEAVLKMASRWAKSDPVIDAVESEGAVPVAVAEAGGDGDSGELEAMAEALEERIAASHAASAVYGTEGSLSSVSNLGGQALADADLKIMDQISPVHSSEDARLDAILGTESSSADSASDGTNQTEWARVERTKESERLLAMQEALHKARQLDRARERQAETERLTEEELLDQRMRDEELARQSLRGSHSLQRHSRGSSRAASFRAHVDSLRPQRGTMARAVNEHDILERESMRGSQRRGSYSTLGERQGMGLVRGSASDRMEGSYASGSFASGHRDSMRY